LAVLVRGLTLLLAFVALLIGGCSNDDSGDVTTLNNTRQIAGGWTGELRQQGLAPFGMAVDIGADGTGWVAYTGLKCGGGWTLEGSQPSSPPRYIYTERIKEGSGGACKGTGTVTLSPIQRHSPNGPAYTRLNYLFAGGGVTSRGLLHRVHAAELAPVFKQAGVGSP
jgi:hypothetical protein